MSLKIFNSPERKPGAVAKVGPYPAGAESATSLGEGSSASSMGESLEGVYNVAPDSCGSAPLSVSSSQPLVTGLFEDPRHALSDQAKGDLIDEFSWVPTIDQDVETQDGEQLQRNRMWNPEGYPHIENFYNKKLYRLNTPPEVPGSSLGSSIIVTSNGKRCNHKRNVLQKGRNDDSPMGSVLPSEKTINTKTSDPGRLIDENWESDFFSQQRKWADRAQRVVLATRYCLFNTGSMGLKQLYSILSYLLPAVSYQAIVKMQKITQPNRNSRIDIWIDPHRAPGLQKALRLTFKLRKHDLINIVTEYALSTGDDPDKLARSVRIWRLDRFQSYRDRQKKPSNITTELPKKDLPRGIMSYNINGYIWKKFPFMNTVRKHKCAVAAGQETKIKNSGYRADNTDYVCYNRPAVEGFPGQFALVHKAYKSYEVKEPWRKADQNEKGADERELRNHVIHIVVNKLINEENVHILACYLPSGSNFRKDRTKVLKYILKVYREILKKDINAHVIVLGDFNIELSVLRQRLLSQKSSLHIMEISGKDASRHPDIKGRKWKGIDHILTDPGTSAYLKKAKIDRQATMSDHWPVYCTIRKDTSLAWTPAKTKWSRNVIRGHARSMFADNRWSLLPVEPIESEDELHREMEDFYAELSTKGAEYGMLSEVKPRIEHLTRRESAAVKWASKAKTDYQNALKRGDASLLPKLHKTMERAWERKERISRAAIKENRHKLIVAANKALLDHEMKEFHQKLEILSGKDRKTEVQHPLTDKDGNLQTTQEGIMDVATTHYQDLSTDRSGRSKNPEAWKNVQIGDGAPQDELEGINRPFGAKEFLMAIRRMRGNNAVPGVHGIPARLYKEYGKKESDLHAHKVKPNTSRRMKRTEGLDPNFVALSEDDLPDELRLQFGQRLLRIFNGSLRLRKIPLALRQGLLVSLYKKGDKNLMKNYRGITLSDAEIKLQLTMVMQRIFEALKEKGLIIPEQSGFQAKEEAIAQFITLFEIVRRRSIEEKTTEAMFTDFEKAFDNVLHEGLWAKLEFYGIKGDLLELIKDIYEKSIVSLRMFGKIGKAFRLFKGTRQGCPLSPLLFIIYINDIFESITVSADFPSGKGGKNRETVKGLLYADDLAGLQNTREDMTTFCKELGDWTTKWEMGVGHSKCNGVQFNATDSPEADKDQEEYLKMTSTITNGIVTHENHYKYLGIEVNNKLGVDDSAKRDHATHLAKEARDAYYGYKLQLEYPLIPINHKRMAVLTRIFPCGTYGSEWLGMNMDFTYKVQAVMNRAMKTICGINEFNENIDAVCLSHELDMPIIHLHMSKMRLRLYMKAKHKLTIRLKELVNDGYTNRKKTWVTGTKAYKNTVLGNYERLNTSDDRYMLQKKSSVKYYVLGLTKKKPRPDYIPFEEWKEAELFQEALACKIYMNADLGEYSSYGFGWTRNWNKLSSHFPQLHTGFTALLRIRVGGAESPAPNKDGTKTCPCCGTFTDSDVPAWAHVIMECPLFQEQRKRHLGTQIRILESAVLKGQLTWDYSRRHKATLYKCCHLLGGNNHQAIGGTYVDLTIQTDDRFVELLRGFGHKPEQYPLDLKTHGCVSVSRFLQLVWPQWTKAVKLVNDSMRLLTPISSDGTATPEE
ncbi:hypothetical protein P7C70_g6907, partial [Phenoliferia sp. Uapishka_3]